MMVAIPMFGKKNLHCFFSVPNHRHTDSVGKAFLERSTSWKLIFGFATLTEVYFCIDFKHFMSVFLVLLTKEITKVESLVSKMDRTFRHQNDTF